MKNNFFIHLIGISLWIILFFISFSSKDIKESFFISSILLGTFYAFWFLIKFGLMDKTIANIKNMLFLNNIKNRKREKKGLEPIKETSKKEIRKYFNKVNLFIPLVFMIVYFLIALVIILI